MKETTTYIWMHIIDLLHLCLMRIGFVVRTRATKHITSGISNALLGWEKLLRKQGHIVDFIFDEDNYSHLFLKCEGSVYSPDTITVKKKHTEIFEFQDSLNFERCINFRDSIVKAISEKIYDVLICNEPESILAAYQLNLADKLKLIYYQHESGTFFKSNNKANVYKDCYYDFIRSFNNNSFYVAYPSSTVFEKKINTFILPLPLDEIMLEPDTITDKDGILFSGRIETRKNFDFFCKSIARTNKQYGIDLKVKVMTCYHHIAKCEAILYEHGLTNYEVKAELSGKEKYDFIKSAKMSYCPSLNETFGLSAWEGLRYHPTILLEEYEWYKTFIDSKNLILANTLNVEEKIFAAYYRDVELDVAISEYQKYSVHLEQVLRELNRDNIYLAPKTVITKNKFFEILNSQTSYVPLAELKRHDSKREVYLFSDIEPFYKASNLFIHQTEEDTYVSLKEDNALILPERIAKDDKLIERKVMQNISHKATRMKYYQFSWLYCEEINYVNILASNKKSAINLFKDYSKVTDDDYECICIEEKFTRKYRFQNGIDFFLKGYHLIVEQNEYNNLNDKRLLYKK